MKPAFFTMAAICVSTIVLNNSAFCQEKLVEYVDRPVSGVPSISYRNNTDRDCWVAFIFQFYNVETLLSTSGSSATYWYDYMEPSPGKLILVPKLRSGATIRSPLDSIASSGDKIAAIWLATGDVATLEVANFPDVDVLNKITISKSNLYYRDNGKTKEWGICFRANDQLGQAQSFFQPWLCRGGGSYPSGLRLGLNKTQVTGKFPVYDLSGQTVSDQQHHFWLENKCRQAQFNEIIELQSGIFNREPEFVDVIRNRPEGVVFARLKNIPIGGLPTVEINK